MVQCLWRDISVTPNGARYSQTLGVQAGTGSFSIAKEQDQIPRVATFKMIDDFGGEISLPNCVASDYTPKNNGNDGTFTFADRRIMWGYSKPIQKRLKGKTDELIGGLLEGLGETGADISSAPSIDYNINYTRPTNQAQMLNDILDEINCTIYYDIGNDSMKIVSADDKLENFDDFENFEPDRTVTGKGGVLPNQCQIIGGYNINQVTLQNLEPVYLDANGKVQVIAEDQIEAYTKQVLSRFGGSTATGDELKNLERSVLKWFRIPELVILYNREDVLPLLNEIVSEVEDGRPDSPHVIGTVASKKAPYQNETGRIEGGYSIDYKNGIVRFNRPQLKKSGAGFVIADLELVCAIANPEENFESVAVSTDRDLTTIDTEFVPLPDLHKKFIDGEATNDEDLEAYSAEFLKNYVKKYKLQNAGACTCVGLQIPPTPAINLSVEYSVSENGAVTILGIDRPATKNALTYEQYKSLQKNAKAKAQTSERKKKEVDNEINTNAGSAQVTPEQDSEGKDMPKEKEGAVKAQALEPIPAGGSCYSEDYDQSTDTYLMKVATTGKQGTFINATGFNMDIDDYFTATPTGRVSRAKVDEVEIGKTYGVGEDGEMKKGGQGFMCVADAGNGEAELMQVGGGGDSLNFYNSSTEIIPAGGAMMPILYQNDIIYVSKPNKNNMLNFYVNDDVEFQPSTSKNISTKATFPVLMNQVIAAGNTAGTQKDSFGFRVYNVGLKIMYVEGGQAYASFFRTNPIYSISRIGRYTNYGYYIMDKRGAVQEVDFSSYSAEGERVVHPLFGSMRSYFGGFNKDVRPQFVLSTGAGYTTGYRVAICVDKETDNTIFAVSDQVIDDGAWKIAPYSISNGDGVQTAVLINDDYQGNGDIALLTYSHTYGGSLYMLANRGQNLSAQRNNNQYSGWCNGFHDFARNRTVTFNQGNGVQYTADEGLSWVDNPSLSSGWWNRQDYRSNQEFQKDPQLNYTSEFEHSSQPGFYNSTDSSMKIIGYEGIAWEIFWFNNTYEYAKDNPDWYWLKCARNMDDDANGRPAWRFPDYDGIPAGITVNKLHAGCNVGNGAWSDTTGFGGNTDLYNVIISANDAQGSFYTRAVIRWDGGDSKPRFLRLSRDDEVPNTTEYRNSVASMYVGVRPYNSDIFIPKLNEDLEANSWRFIYSNDYGETWKDSQ